MRSVLVVLGGLALSAASPMSAYMLDTRATSKSWAGTNLYFIQGLSDQRQDDYISSLKDFGVKALRVWVNGQPGNGQCEKGSHLEVSVPDLETTLGEGKYNDETLDALDKVIDKLAKSGIKAIISPHNANSLEGSAPADVYSKTFGGEGFYTKSEAFEAYDKRLSHILNYTGKTSGKVWKNWPEAIAAFDLQNEPMISKAYLCQDNDKAGWICGRAKHLREELGADNQIKISSGGIGGDVSNECYLTSAATECEALDLLAIHRYAGKEANWAGSAQDYISRANGKLVYIEEWGIDQSAGLDPKTEYPANVQELIDGKIPNMYWQILPSFDEDCSYDPKSDEDPFGIAVDSGVDFKQWITKVDEADAAQDWSFLVG